jgi:hypothetical protein
MRRTRIRAVKPRLLASALLLLSACDGADADAGAPASEITVPAGERADCLTEVWESQPQRDEDFDREHDRAEGGSISCATRTSASQYRDAITALRQAAASGDKAAVLGQIAYPLLYIDAAGESQTLEQPAVEARFGEIFDAPTLALLQQADLGNMTVVPEQGGFFALGAVWLVVGRPGGRPRVFTVNHQALAEAAAAQRAR